MKETGRLETDGDCFSPPFCLPCCHGLFGEFDFVTLDSYCRLSVEI